MELINATLISGTAATLVMDAWGLLRKPLLGMSIAEYRFVGRWIGHMLHGRLAHDSIAKAPAVGGENFIGWTVHYLTGIAFAAGLLVLAGRSWIEHPTLLPALGFGLLSVAIPLLIIQPAMGAGIAGRRTANPKAVRLQSLLTHAVFGLGLFAGGWITRWSTAP